MEGITLIFIVAVLIEALVEYAKSIYAFFEKDEFKAGITQLITILISIALGFAFNITLFSLLGITVNATLDVVLSGIIISRGANYTSDFISKLKG